MKNTKKAQTVRKSIDRYLAGYRINRGGKPAHITLYKSQADAWGVKGGDRYSGIPIDVVPNS